MALSWTAPFDPHEVKDYVVDFTAEMDATSDTLTAVRYTLPADAIAAGLQIDSQGLVLSNKGAQVWLSVQEAEEANLEAAIVAAGGSITYELDLEVDTTAGRLLNRTVKLKLKVL